MTTDQATLDAAGRLRYASMYSEVHYSDCIWITGEYWLDQRCNCSAPEDVATVLEGTGLNRGPGSNG